MQQPHNFIERLSFSERASDESFWLSVYRKAFPGMVNHMPCPGDNETQRAGIDRLILLNNGRVLRIDEKKREKVYPDILLEYISVDTTGAPGWIEKNLAIDYLAYAFMPTQRVYLLDWLTLRRAWVANRDNWKRTYRRISAQNIGYKTWSVAVPIVVLQQAMTIASVVQLDALEITKDKAA